MPSLARVAVCLVGEPRSIGLTASNLRSNLLDAWDADGFVASTTNARCAPHTRGYRDSEAGRGIPQVLLRLRVLPQVEAGRCSRGAQRVLRYGDMEYVMLHLIFSLPHA